MKIDAAFILAAGLGTRLKPWTDHHPKALAMVNGKSLLQRNVEYLQQFGIKNVVVNVHHFAEQIVEAIEKNKGWGSNIKISDETNEVLETGGGLLKAQPLLENYTNFLVMNCDILTNLTIHQLAEQHQKTQAMATLAVSRRASSRGLLFNEKMEMVGWKNATTNEEKLPALHKITNPPQLFAFSGIHLLHKSIFKEIHFSGKFSIIDVYLDLCSSQKIVGYDHSQDLVLDVGKPEAIEKAEKLFL